MTTAPLTVDSAAQLLHSAGRAGGVPTAGARVTRRGEVTVFDLGDDVVAEVCGPPLVPAVRHRAAVGRWLHDNGIRVVGPPRDVAWLVETEDHAVTFRQALPPHRSGSYPQIAGMLRRLHELSPPADPVLPPVDPFRRIQQRLTATALVPADQRDALLSRLRDARAAFARLPAGRPHTPLHGDAWAGNIVSLADGDVLLRDLERVSVGPPEWDLVSTAIDRSTFGAMSQEQYQRFSETYGYDVLSWPGYPTLLSIRELRVVAFALAAARDSAHLVPQAQARVRDLLAGDRPWPGWQPL